MTFAAAAQHRDESQMLRKPGVNPAHMKAHLRHPAAQLRDSLAATDSIRASEAAAFTSPEAEAEEADEYLQAGIRTLQLGDGPAALRNFGMAARKGNHEAQYRIGLMYRDGTGIRANDTEAAYWFRKAGSNGHAASQYEIGLCFLEGRGVLPDTRVAAEWMWRAAEQGHPQAALHVARMYRDGVGMQRDLRRAERYMEIAARAGLENAAEELKQIREHLSSPPSAAGKSSARPRQRDTAPKSLAKKNSRTRKR